MGGSFQPILVLIVVAGSGAAAQPFLSPPTSNGLSSQVIFRPSIAVVIGLFSIMFSLTFFLLMYAKFCHSRSADVLSGFPDTGESIYEEGRFSGIEKAVIESLPFFRFSVLKGSRDGLECSVCLSRFDDAEILRLLPRCKHAFHMGCVDRWLDSHSSCPLCRTRVDVDDIAFFKLSASSRRPSGRLGLEVAEDGNDAGLDLYVEREHERRFTPFRWAERMKNISIGKRKPLHSFNHRILVSEAVFRSRWSDFNSADLITLHSEMHSVISSKRFDQISNDATISPEFKAEGVSKIKEEMERKRILESKAVTAEDYSIEILARDRRALISPASRCMSDITSVRSNLPSGSRGVREEKVRQMWMPIARRTLKWFAGKETATMLPA